MMGPLSKFAFKFNLRRYTVAAACGDTLHHYCDLYPCLWWSLPDTARHVIERL
jgi:hypothetical protein